MARQINIHVACSTITLLHTKLSLCEHNIPAVTPRLHKTLCCHLVFNTTSFLTVAADFLKPMFGQSIFLVIGCIQWSRPTMQYYSYFILHLAIAFDWPLISVQSLYNMQSRPYLLICALIRLSESVSLQTSLSLSTCELKWQPLTRCIIMF